MPELLCCVGFIKCTWQIAPALCLICRHPSAVPGCCCWQCHMYNHWAMARSCSMLVWMMVLAALLLQKCWCFSEKERVISVVSCWAAEHGCNFFTCTTLNVIFLFWGRAKWKFIGRRIFNAARESSWLWLILKLVMNVCYQGWGIWRMNFPGFNHLIRLLSVTPSPVIYLTQSFTPPSALPGEWISQVVCMTSSLGLSESFAVRLMVSHVHWQAGWGAELENGFTGSAILGCTMCFES